MVCRTAPGWLLGTLLLLSAVACSSEGSSPTVGSDYQPVYAAQFSNFCSWSSATATAANDASDGIHGLGPLRVYWSHSPPAGSTVFPVGTLILKESQEDDPAARTIFAMAKVGGGYNSDGAVNWRWFSLKQDANCNVVQLWSQAVPPPGETYSGQPVGDCNGCHEQVRDNDYVWDSALQLSKF